MKILQIHNKVPFPPKDGGSLAVFSLSECFAKQGHNVHIAALNTNKHFINISSFENQLPENIKLFTFNINTDTKPLKALLNLIFSSIPYNATRFISKGFNRLLIELLNTFEYDVIQIEGLYMMTYIHTIRKQSKAMVAFRAHNVEHQIWKGLSDHIKNPLKKYYLKNLYKRILTFEKSFINQYDVLIPITNNDLNFFHKAGNCKKIHTTPTGINIEKYDSEAITIDKNLFFHLGSLDWKPNTDGLLWFLNNIWTSVINKYSNITFNIAGRNAPDSFIEKLAAFKNIIYSGEVDNAFNMMIKNTIMIVPLFSGSGMRIKIIEGLAVGNIIICTSKAAEGIPVIHKQHLLIADSVEEFIQCIDEIQSNPAQLMEISNNAKQFISNNFDNFALSKELLSFYRDAIHAKKQ